MSQYISEEAGNDYAVMLTILSFPISTAVFYTSAQQDPQNRGLKPRRCYFEKRIRRDAVIFEAYAMSVALGNLLPPYRAHDIYKAHFFSTPSIS